MASHEPERIGGERRAVNEHPIDSGRQPASVSSIRSNREILVNFHARLATLEERLIHSAGAIEATCNEVRDCEIAIFNEVEDHAACDNALLLEQQRHSECLQAYQSLCKESEQMMAHTHGLAVSNLSLQHEIHEARKTIQTLGERVMELESIVTVNSQADSGMKDRRILELENERDDMMREHRKALYNAADRIIAGEEKIQEFEKTNRGSGSQDAGLAASVVKEGQSVSQPDLENDSQKRSSESEQGGGAQGKQRKFKRARKPRQLKIKESSTKVGCN
ncbi:MAG: hypothetical protein M1840_000548 [Geoglossum simile]|nr:MAG: hypothetical protein M1840_000548 [Geoglossum simile]